jgi:protein tyrosine phosphatase (PTP) superfamily phosphohydrolase (DUF442 family)
LINQIKNHVQFTKEISTSGQPTENQFSEISQNGFNAVINLAMPDSNSAIENEGFIVTSLGMTYFHIPVPFDAPEKKHLILFLKLLIALEDKKVWVHCAKNYRVSAFMLHYQKLMYKLTGNKLESTVFEKWQPDDIWQQLLAIEVEGYEVGL